MGDDAAGGSSGEGVWLLCYFLHRYLDFRVPEVDSLAELAGAGGQIAWCEPAATRRAAPGGCARCPCRRSAPPRAHAADA